MLGLLESLADEQNIGLEPHMVSNVSKVITFLETFKALRLASEQGASHDKLDISYQRQSSYRIQHPLPQILSRDGRDDSTAGSSGLIMIPSGGFSIGVRPLP